MMPTPGCGCCGTCVVFEDDFTRPGSEELFGYDSTSRWDGTENDGHIYIIGGELILAYGTGTPPRVAWTTAPPTNFSAAFDLMLPQDGVIRFGIATDSGDEYFVRFYQEYGGTLCGSLTLEHSGSGDAIEAIQILVPKFTVDIFHRVTLCWDSNTGILMVKIQTDDEYCTHAFDVEMAGVPEGLFFEVVDASPDGSGAYRVDNFVVTETKNTAQQLCRTAFSDDFTGDDEDLTGTVTNDWEFSGPGGSWYRESDALKATNTDATGIRDWTLGAVDNFPAGAEWDIDFKLPEGGSVSTTIYDPDLILGIGWTVLVDEDTLAITAATSGGTEGSSAAVSLTAGTWYTLRICWNRAQSRLFATVEGSSKKVCVDTTIDFTDYPTWFVDAGDGDTYYDNAVVTERSTIDDIGGGYYYDNGWADCPDLCLCENCPCCGPRGCQEVTYGILTIEQQTITISGDPSGGTYAISWDNGTTVETTDPIAWDADQQTVQDAIRTIPGLEEADVETTGTSPNFTHTVSLYNDTDPAELTSDFSLLTGGTPDIAHATTIPFESLPDCRLQGDVSIVDDDLVIDGTVTLWSSWSGIDPDCQPDRSTRVFVTLVAEDYGATFKISIGDRWLLITLESSDGAGDGTIQLSTDESATTMDGLTIHVSIEACLSVDGFDLVGVVAVGSEREELIADGAGEGEQVSFESSGPVVVAVLTSHNLLSDSCDDCFAEDAVIGGCQEHGGLPLTCAGDLYPKHIRGYFSGRAVSSDSCLSSCRSIEAGSAILGLDASSCTGIDLFPSPLVWGPGGDCDFEAASRQCVCTWSSLFGANTGIRSLCVDLGMYFEVLLSDVNIILMGDGTFRAVATIVSQAINAVTGAPDTSICPRVDYLLRSDPFSGPPDCVQGLGGLVLNQYCYFINGGGSDTPCCLFEDFTLRLHNT